MRQTENKDLETKRKLKTIAIFCLSLFWNFLFVCQANKRSFCTWRRSSHQDNDEQGVAKDVDETNKKIQAERQTENWDEQSFSVCLWTEIFFLSLSKRKLKGLNIFYLSLNFDFPFVSYKYLFESLFGSPSALSCQGFHTYWHLF